MVSIVVSGATGLLGRALFSLLKSKLSNCKIAGLGFLRSSSNIRKCDLTNSGDIDKLFDELRPKIFVHCAAERRPDIVEGGNMSAKVLNVTATELLAKKCHEFDCTLIYISSDYVFDGTKPPFSEKDAPNPLNEYGLQKCEGEKVVLAASHSNIVVRMPILYGPLDSAAGLDESAVTLLFKAVKNANLPVKFDHVAIRFPTYTPDVAEVLCNIVKELTVGNSSMRGVFHVSGDEALTKYDMACRMASVFGLPSSHLSPDTETALKGNARRPLNAKLSCKRAEELKLMIKMTPFDEGIKSCLLPFV